MRKIALYLIFCSFYSSCKKETKEVIVINPAAKAMQLNIDQIINDSTIVLRWDKFTGTGFQKYRLVRSATYLKNGQFINFLEPVDSSSSVDHLSFTENKMPLARDIYYDLYVSKDTTLFNRGFVPVARVYYQRPNSLFYGIPRDVLIDKQLQRAYVVEQNRITVTDYTGRVIVSKDFPPGIGYCSLGDFSGTKELYVPVNDGWLQILDAVTLQPRDKIYVAGYEIGSAIAVNNKLYVSSSDRSSGGYSNCIKVYERATKSFIGRTGYWDRTRLLQLESSSVEMIDITLNLIPTNLAYYQFSADGVPIYKKEDSYHGDFPLDPGIVRSFPDGSKIITSASGTIYNKSLVFDRYLKQSGNYSDFAFNANGSVIYAAYASQKKIDVVTYPAATTISNYTTAFYPYKIYRDGNSLICISKTYTNQQMTYLLVEKVNL